jgi:hypothetical protein
VGNVGRKWYIGFSAEQAIAGYPDLNFLIHELFTEQPPDLISKLSTLIGGRAQVVPVPYVEDAGEERYSSGTAFEIEEDLR